MLDTSTEKEIANITSTPDLIGTIGLTSDKQSTLNDWRQSNVDTASAHLPQFLLDNGSITLTNSPADSILGDVAHFLVPDEINLLSVGVPSAIRAPELKSPIDKTTQKALTRDADLYPPVRNPDGSTTYTVVQTGITDRPGRDNGIDYYTRTVNVMVPKDSASLNDCTYTWNQRETITKKQFDKLIAKDKATDSNLNLYAHGVSTPDTNADKEALLLQLSNNRPTVNLDWTANAPDLIFPIEGYGKDTISAKRANDNKQFEAAIDHTIQKFGAGHSTLIGFSHGGFFDTRYLAHRVARGLPRLDTVILTHPDVPISAPELQVHGKPELFKDAAKHAYVIGSTNDLAMKVAALASNLLPDTPTFEHGKTEERLGDNSDVTRSFIRSEGAEPISEVDRDSLVGSQHFLNPIGISQLLNADNAPTKDAQSYFNQATQIGYIIPDHQKLLAS